MGHMSGAIHPEPVLERLSRVLGSQHLRTDPDSLDAHGWDALSLGRMHPQARFEPTRPLCVCFPGCTVEVAEILRLANEERVSVVPYGGGSGLMGGAISLSRGIVVDLQRMDRVRELDIEARTISVQAGIVLERLNTHLEPHGLIVGHDPWTLPVATVGGALSTNGLGYRGGKYGAMGDQVLGLEAVLPQGDLFRARPATKASTGIDLKSLFIGGEGCFGIVTEVTLKVFPRPETRVLSAYRFASFEGGFEAVKGLFAAGLQPCLMDYGDETDDPKGSTVLYLGFEGKDELVRAENHVAEVLCRDRGAISLPLARVQHFWNERHAAAYRFMQNRQLRRAPVASGVYQDWLHVALPISRVLDFRQYALEVAARWNVNFRDSGLWTRPELFSIRLAKQGDPDDRASLEEAVSELLHAVHEFRGSVEYCHGIGVKLAFLMSGEHGHGLQVMRSIKQVLDPLQIMNPGKLAL